MCSPKEPRFFSGHNWSKGLGWYESLFANARDCKAVGEASPAYTWAPLHKEVPQRIHRCLGDIRYIYVLRHPVERMISHYRHALIYHWIPEGTSFEDALDLRPELKHCSRYFFQLEQYLSYTSREQWHLPLLEEMTRDPASFARGLYEFLEVREVAASLAPLNVTDRKRRFPAWARRLKTLTPAVPSGVRGIARELVSKVAGGRVVEKPVISEDLGRALLSELKPDVDRLSEFCSRDLAAIWRLERAG